MHSNKIFVYLNIDTIVNLFKAYIMKKFNSIIEAIEAFIVWGVVIFIFALALTSCATPKQAGDYSAPDYFFTVDQNGAKIIPPFKDYGPENKTEKK